MPIDYEALLAPFPADEIEWRVAQAGRNQRGIWCKVLAYVTARAIQNRLDAVVGPQNWRNEFVFANGGVLCGLSIYTEEHGWVTKWDGSDASDIEPFKGALSGATKRAAVQWGIGRVLYSLEDGFAKVHEQGKHFAKTKVKEDGRETWIDFRWDPPQLPAWAVAPVKKVHQDGTITKDGEVVGNINGMGGKDRPAFNRSHECNSWVKRIGANTPYGGPHRSEKGLWRSSDDIIAYVVGLPKVREVLAVEQDRQLTAEDRKCLWGALQPNTEAALWDELYAEVEKETARRRDKRAKAEPAAAGAAT